MCWFTLPLFSFPPLHSFPDLGLFLSPSDSTPSLLTTSSGMVFFKKAGAPTCNIYPSSGNFQPSCSPGARVPRPGPGLGKKDGCSLCSQGVCLPFMVPSARASAGPRGARVALDGAGSWGPPQAPTAAPRCGPRVWGLRGDTCGSVPLLRRRRRRRIPGVAGWGRHAARRSRASCVAPRPQSWPRAHPSLRLPPSLVVTAWAPAQINFLDIFKTAAAGALCAPGARLWVRGRVCHSGG